MKYMELSDIYVNKAYAKLIIEKNLTDKIMCMLDTFLYDENAFHRLGDKPCRLLFGYEESDGNSSVINNVNNTSDAYCRVPYSGEGAMYMCKYLLANRVSMTLCDKDIYVYLSFSATDEIRSWHVSLDKLLNGEI